MVTQPQEELDRLLADPEDPDLRERYRQRRRERELLKEFDLAPGTGSCSAATTCPSPRPGWNCWWAFITTGTVT